jgi:uncharacterized protein (TIGR01777 family)
MPTDPATLCDWHVRPGALERLVPPWDAPRVLERSGGIDHDGARVVLRMTGGLRWTAEHSDFEPGRRFRDRQVSGPFALWDHDHRFEPCGHGSVLTDEIRWRLPAGRLADLAASGFVDRALDRMFMWRHRRTAEDLAMHARLGGEPLRVAVSGATGLVGSQLLATLGTAGHQVRRIARRPPGPGELFAEDFVAWNASEQRMDATALEGLDAVVHLAGEGIADGRWNDARKRRILESRVQGTRTLARTLARLSSPPRVLVCASAIGFYGHRGDAELDEGADAGRGFLPDVCRAWEAATAEAEAAGIRVVHLRVGIVLDPRGGALAAMAPAFQAAVGGPLGDGRAWMSWVALDDVNPGRDAATAGPAARAGDGPACAGGRDGRRPAPGKHSRATRPADRLRLRVPPRTPRRCSGHHARPPRPRRRRRCHRAYPGGRRAQTWLRSASSLGWGSR